MEKNYIFFIIAYLLTVTVVYAVYRAIAAKKNKAINKSKYINQRGRNKFYLFYKLFRNTPFFKKVFQKIKKQTEMIYPSDPISVNKEATKITLRALLLAVGIAVVTITFGRGNLLVSCMGIMSGMVTFNYSTKSTFRKMENKLLEQMKDFLSAVRSHYINCPIIEDAIELTLDEIPYQIGLHISKIYEIITSPIMEEKVEEYTVNSPNRYFLLLLSICSSTKEYGGEKFLDSLIHLKEEVNVEILKREAIKKSFTGMSFGSLIVVTFIKPVEWWVVNNMPDLENFYSSSYAKLLMVILFAGSFICYYLVEILKDDRQGELIQENIFTKISNIRIVSVFFNKIINRRYTKARMLNEKMKEVGDQTGPKAFMVKQVLFALIAFILLNSTFFVSSIVQKCTMLGNYVAEFDSTIVPNERYMKVMQETAQTYVTKVKNNKMLNREDLTKQIMSDNQIKNEDYAGIVADEIIREVNKYRNTYFKFYHLLIAVLGAFIAYCVPMWLLNFKCKVAGMSKEDEVAQFQTLILILMNADGMRLELILEWMERFAYSFKSTIRDCIIALESGEKEALETMKASEENMDFRRFTDCLLAIDETDVKTAFNEVVVDRIYAIDKRKQRNQFDVSQKSTKAMLIAIAPLIAVIVCYGIVPMMIMAIQMSNQMDLFSLY